jgi:hypothetical protein
MGRWGLLPLSVRSLSAGRSHRDSASGFRDGAEACRVGDRGIRMPNSVPYWIQVRQALLTPAIALLAVVIGFFQWRTAQQKVALDLFDRRLAKYNAVREVVAKVISAGAATQKESFHFLQALDGIEFLFGAEIIAALNKINQAIGLLTVLGPERKGAQGSKGPGEELKALVRKEREALNTVESSYSTFRTRLSPYMRMHQKSTWFLWRYHKAEPTA